MEVRSDRQWIGKIFFTCDGKWVHKLYSAGSMETFLEAFAFYLNSKIMNVWCENWLYLVFIFKSVSAWK